jgi:hypothetical protein
MSLQDYLGDDIDNGPLPERTEVDADFLFEWLEKKLKDGAMIELDNYRNMYTIKINHMKTLHPTVLFEGPTLLLAIKAAWEKEKRKK